MLAHANREALAQTLALGEAVFYSRSRQAIWRKGETSGNTLAVHGIYADCDGDALIYLVEPAGPSCHTGRRSCFFRRLGAEGEWLEDEAGARPTLAAMMETLKARRRSGADRSYTKRLLEGGAEAIGAKLREEADELAEAIASEAGERVVAEAADLLYHLAVGLICRDRTLREVEAELDRRSHRSGLEEKASRRRPE